ncbi:hypothetical protein UAJ10_25610 [Nitrospirillum sp. BR 11164]|uniref:hypothetical protein n=1 Tax=Nitrospirillum sp. BR 11164 TaxID=3104324 RepID=UPI002AFEEE98|nr:hypothetical protein [Nitrospirillum sp. BR 11164]MEA1652373.1 hypothetical protein [Nitrospirillum sp. BR 11164]
MRHPFPLRRCLCLTAAFFFAAQPAAWAWSNHTLCTWPAVEAMPQVAGHSVPAETLAGFLAKEAAALPKVLEEEEQWARAHVPFYAPRPDGLAFKVAVDADAAALKQAFVHAIRVNEEVPIALYRQRPPGTDAAAGRGMDWPALSILKNPEDVDLKQMERLEEGEAVPVADVVATASNEPDFGLDIGLFQDNGQKQGALYSFGTQPFGNPLLDYGSQAPFHMGFYHESGILYKAAPYLQKTYPEARVHLYMTLSRFAFAQGHPYWGWRFAGWAIHYVQDMAQPYHARVLPGVGVPSMLWTSVLDMAGVHGPKLAALNRVTNRHTSLENYQKNRMAAAYARGDMGDPLLAALRDTHGDTAVQRLQPDTLREVSSAQSVAVADALDAQLERSFPARYVSDAATNLDGKDADLYALSRQAPAAEQAKLADMVADRMRQAGRDTRAVIRAVAPDDTAAAQR